MSGPVSCVGHGSEGAPTYYTGACPECARIEVYRSCVWDRRCDCAACCDGEHSPLFLWMPGDDP
jgi:hypothetical protein